MNFAEALKEEALWIRTENGAMAKRTSGEACLDLFSTIGSLRETEELRIQRLAEEAYQENPLMAAKIIFYGRDIREGLGERQTFRYLLAYMAKKHPEALLNNLKYIGYYGRYDDLYALVGTPLEDQMWQTMKEQFELDVSHFMEGKPVSLLAKWLKTADASSPTTRKLGILTAKKLGYSVYDFKRKVRALRKEIGIVEAKMSAGQWGEISYPEVPSRAMMVYRKAFGRHDAERFFHYIERAAAGEEIIHSDTLYPYDIVEKILYGRRMSTEDIGREQEYRILEAQWKQLPDYVEKNTNAIVMADVSGSMMGRPMASAIGLAIYFAERNHGDYHNLFMTFSNQPKVVELKGETLEEKIRNVHRSEWGMNTNLRAAFDKVLKIAVEHHTSEEDLPRSIIVISDMEIDYCGDKEWTFYDKMKAKYERYGYDIPNLVFWNVNSRSDVFHADAKRKGVQLVSGQSAVTFRHLMKMLGMTPIQMMEEVIGAERYVKITIAPAA